MNLTLKQMQRFYDTFEFAPDGCWLWKGEINNGGYGAFHLNGKSLRAHRVSYELYNGPIPEGLVLDHLCRVRSCVNPEHLEAVTTEENLLRGTGIGVVNKQKTHCPKGHPYTGSNLIFAKSKNGLGRRICRICKNQTAKELWQKQHKTQFTVDAR